jgi:hypothetical protein
MRYERLFIEKQLNEVDMERKRLENEIASYRQRIADIKYK